MKLAVASMLLMYSFVASAHPTVEHMTCAKAAAYAKKHGRYWKDAGPDGAIPIYPVYTLETVRCSGRSFTEPQMERTLDIADCVVGWYCLSY